MFHMTNKLDFLIGTVKFHITCKVNLIILLVCLKEMLKENAFKHFTTFLADKIMSFTNIIHEIFPMKI